MGGRETDVLLNKNDDNNDFTPIERIILTANGNLQRIMSAYYGSKVTVEVIKCDRISHTLFAREVNLLVDGKVRDNHIICFIAIQ